jgi:hypothetical protein
MIENNIVLLNAEDSAKANGLLADKHLARLSAWEPGVYRALSADGGDQGFVNCSAGVAQVVNGCLAARSI